MYEKNNLMGKRVCVTKKYQRTYGPIREWQSINIPNTIGWVVGFRTIQNGYMEQETGEYGHVYGEYFVANEYIPCVLISRTPYENPMRVPLDGFEVMK
jgi:hypothetical protein